MTHPVFTLISALLVSTAMAAAEDRTVRVRLAVGVRMFVCCLLSVAGGSWVMRLIHG
jgi:hypothetical protein